MGSTFGGYNIAYSGMYVSQAALGAVSNNLSNLSTTGASRTRVANTEENIVLSSTTSVGDGVDVASITRVRDELLDGNYRTQNADAGYLSVKSGNLEYMGTILSEFESDDGTTSNGVQQALEDFFTAWEELSMDSGTESARQSVTSAAESLLSALSELDNQLQQLQVDAVGGVQDGVDRLNEMAEQVAELNAQIKLAEVGGGEATYLRDQRDVLLDQMSSLADITASESNGSLRVTIGGVTLVNDDTAHELVVSGDGSTTNPLAITWTDYNCEADIGSGSILAYMEDADQTGYAAIDTTTLPYNFTTTATSSISNMRQSINVMITTLAAEVNTLHSSGTGLDGTTGLDFFTVVDSSQPLSLTNIQVNPELDDPDKVAAGTSGEDGDNTIADAICGLNTEDCFQFDGLSLDVDEFYDAIVSWIATAGDDATSSYETQNALAEQIDSQRQSIIGISSEEEMSNMIAFQNAYAASARVLSTMDGLIAGLISDLG